MVHSLTKKRYLSYVRVNYKNACPSLYIYIYIYIYSKDTTIGTFDHVTLD